MGGAVSVSSAVGVGTAFTVALPAGDAPVPAATAADGGDRRGDRAPTLPSRPRPRRAQGRCLVSRGAAASTVLAPCGGAGRRLPCSSPSRSRRSSSSRPQSGGRGRVRVNYDRRAAVAYADAWALKGNPEYWSSPDNDCANFVSQCLAAGGLRPTYDAGREWRSNGTEFPTVAWVNCGAQRRALSARSAGHSRYVARSSRTLPPAGRPATSCTSATWWTASSSGST